MTAISNRRTNQNEGQFNDRRREQYIEAPLPSSEDSERVIIGAILLDNGLMAQVIEILRPEHFYSPLNRRVYAAMVEMFKEGKNIDTVLILEQTARSNPLAVPPRLPT
jgi:replicative DNA helicase